MSDIHKTNNVTWDLALREFLLHKEAHYAKKTVLYYKVQLSGLITWAEQNDVPFEGFGKRHLDSYLIERKDSGKAAVTVHHAAICAKAFMSWCQKDHLLDRSLLSEYMIRKAPTPVKYMPSQEDMVALIKAAHDIWDINKRPELRHEDPASRIFHRDRNYAILIGLLDSACRIGEMLSLKVEDYDRNSHQITIRQSKGREPRNIPVSRSFETALEPWLKIRTRLTRNLKPGEDEGWLFITEYGGRIDEGRVLFTLKRYAAYAGLSNQITLHSLRRYSLNKLAKTDLLGAQRIAGHKETSTTLLYTRIDADHVRSVHEQASVVAGIVANKRLAKKERKRLL
jgi:site-specific recombinase XerD